MEESYSKINGTVQRVIYRSPDSDYAVLELRCGQDDLVAVGQLSAAKEGEELELTGQYTVHPSFGPQFKAEYFEKRLPATAGAILQYLSSGAVKGIGPVTARRIVEKFGDDALNVAYNDPEELTKIKGISLQKALEIGQEVARNYTMRDLLAFLGAFGIQPVYAMRAYRKFGTDALDVLSVNPFALCGEEIGLDFVSADRMADEMGISSENEVRIRAGIDHVFVYNQSNGHTCLPKEKLADAAARLLSLSPGQILDQVDKMEAEGQLRPFETETHVYDFPPELYEAQRGIAQRLAQMSALLRRPKPKKLDRIIQNVENEWNITYAEEQRQAIELSVTEGILILTGGPGTGKTTTLRGILQVLESSGSVVGLAAPTGRAAQRMTEVTGHPAQTIHRLLEASAADSGRRGFQKNERNQLKEDVLIIDETSMVDTWLMDALLRAMKPTARLILVGDSNQLPSIGPGNLLADLIGSGCVATVQLHTIFRQAAESLIVVNAHRIVAGEMPDLTQRKKDFFFLKGDTEQTVQLVGDLVQRRLPESYEYDRLWDIQVITPSRKGELGTENLNRILQQRLNPPRTGRHQVKFMGQWYREGDKVMQIKNNYDLPYTKDGTPGAGVFNGDIGVITSIDPYGETMTIDFDGKVCDYPVAMLSELDLAYAVTIHKSQGSEFRAVIIPVSGERSRLQFRNLLYTGVTRAKELLILAGSERGVETMVRNNRKTMRYTLLKTMMKQECEGY